MSNSTSKQFQRNIEDFTCFYCGTVVFGNGYTNHCPKCLWSKHVDINPGDRASECDGMMEPIGVDVKGDEYTIIHRCIVCGHVKRNKAKSEDNFDVLVHLSIPESERKTDGR